MKKAGEGSGCSPFLPVANFKLFTDMIHTLIRSTSFAACLLLCACQSCHSDMKEGEKNEEKVEASARYANPVIRVSVPDPTVIRAQDGAYYLYGTEDIRNLPIYRSDDLVNWVQVGTAFTNDTRPGEVKGASLWAPEIRYVKGKYVLFYSLAIWGQEWVSTVGYAVADKPEGPFASKGVVFSSRDVNVQNSIDQFFYEEDGKYYMLWGSFRGIYLMELDVTDDLVITPKKETMLQVAGTAFEGVNLWKRDGYYYLFASIGSCCEGAKSTYTTVVGRSESLTGPYLSKEGNPMLDNGYTTLISKSSAFVGVGHNSILQTDDAGNTWMLYHGFQINKEDDGRQVLLDRVLWDADGWPYVKNGQPSVDADCPVINQ